MKNIFRLVLLAAFAALGLWLWTLLFPSPEKIILKKIASLAATATFGSGDNNIIRASKASRLAAAFASDAQISIDAPGVGAHTFSGRDEIRESALGGFASLSALQIKFLDASAQVAADKQTAEVDCTAQVNVGDNKDSGVQEVRFKFKKISGDWLITRAETIKTLQ